MKIYYREFGNPNGKLILFIHLKEYFDDKVKGNIYELF